MPNLPSPALLPPLADADPLRRSLRASGGLLGLRFEAGVEITTLADARPRGTPPKP